jgi:uncharacterized protein YbjQ (UPF0145 family)
MIIVNTDFVTGREIETMELVRGSMIQSKHIGRDIMAGLKTIVGGELHAYSDMINEARAIATKRMVEQAESLGADAVINVRYATSAVMQGAAEVMVYGTAVRFPVGFLVGPSGEGGNQPNGRLLLVGYCIR